jgi:rhodanese-related sulfurtransferase
VRDGKSGVQKMKTSLSVFAILAAVAILGAPFAGAQDESAFADPAVVAASAAPPQAVAPADVLKMINDKSSDIALVDTQPADGYVLEHIPSAINYPWVMQIKNFPIPLPRNKVLIFYGSCPNDTSDIVRKLAEFGYLNVRILDGGIEKWIALKYPIATSAPPAPELSQLNTKPAKNDSPSH